MAFVENLPSRARVVFSVVVIDFFIRSFVDELPV